MRIEVPARPDEIEELVKQRLASMDGSGKPRLRFDKVALRFVRDVKQGLADAVPGGKTVAFTIAAPIRVASRAADELQEKIRAQLERRARVDVHETIQGNDIWVRILDSLRGSPKVVGFVHTPAAGAAERLIDLTESFVKPRRR